MWRMVLILLCALSFFWIGCDEDDDEISITGALDPAPNEAPRFVAHGPDFEDPLQVVQGGHGGYGFGIGPRMWVQVADANGIDDISIVVVDVDSVVVVAMIARADTGHITCAQFDPNGDTLNVDALVAGTYPGLQSTVLDQVQGGRFETSDFFLVPNLLPDFTELSPSLGLSVKPCSYSDDSYLTRIGVYPPGSTHPSMYI